MSLQIDWFTGDGHTTSFTLRATPSGYVEFFYNGMLEQQSNFSIVGRVVTLTFTPALNDFIAFVYDSAPASTWLGPNPIDLTTLSAVKLWVQAGITQNQQVNVPAASPFTLQTVAQSNIGVAYGSGLSLAEIVGTPSTGQYNFSNGLYTFAAGDAGAAVLLSYIGNTNDDQIIQDAITAFSAYVLRVTGRGPADGSIPAHSPLVEPVTYDEFYDGSGTMRLQLRNNPITAVASLNINGQAIKQSTSVNTWGWVIDGDAKFISLRGGYSPTIATFQNFPYQRTAFAGGAGPGFCVGIQNVEVEYTAGFAATPIDLSMMARKVVSLNYKRRSWIGQRSQQMANGAGTVSYNDWEMADDDRHVLQFYKRRVA